MNRIKLRADVPDGFDGVYLFGSLGDFLAGNPNQFRQAFGNSTAGFPVTSVGGFVQDHWSLARQLTVDLGARYDFERLPAGFNQGTNNVSPRIGLAWSPSPKWVFRAGYGVFFDRYVLANLTRAIEKNGSQAFEQVVDGNAAASLFAATQGGPLVAPVSGIASSIFRPDPLMATPYSQQASAGAECLVAKNLTLRADYLFVHGVKLPRTLNVNLLPPVVLTLANASSLGVPNPTPQQIGREVFSLGRLNTQFGDIYQLQNSANSTSWHQMTWTEGDLLSFGEEVIGITIQNHLADNLQRDELFWDQLCGIKNIKLKATYHLFVKDLKTKQAQTRENHRQLSLPRGPADGTGRPLY